MRPNDRNDLALLAELLVQIRGIADMQAIACMSARPAPGRSPSTPRYRRFIA